MGSLKSEQLAVAVGSLSCSGTQGLGDSGAQFLIPLSSQIPLDFVAVDAHEVAEFVDGDDLVGLFLELGFDAF